MKRSKRIWKWLLAVVILSLFTIRIYREFVPAGAKPIAYLGFSIDAGNTVSPDGTLYSIRINDAGGMHSGNHWTWVVHHHWFFGLRIKTAGYLGPEYAVDGKTISVDWDGNEPVLPFLPGRYND